MPNTFQFPQEIYGKHLREIGGVKFSSREVEVIAAILLDKETKQISNFLPLTEKREDNKTTFGCTVSSNTVEAHIDKIFDKLSPLFKRHLEELKNKRTKRDKIKYVIKKYAPSSVLEEYCRSIEVEHTFLGYLQALFKKQFK